MMQGLVLVMVMVALWDREKASLLMVLVMV
jgi:hypothetical protein